MRHLLTACACIALGAGAADARPVSYEGGWTTIAQSDRMNTGLLIHYTPRFDYSIGLKTEWDRTDDLLFNGAQATWLAHRWFGQDYQANLYAFAGAGVAQGINDNDRGARGAGYAGIMADWETRRWFVSWMGRVSDMGEGAHAMQSARVGVAPYIAGFGELHTWLMVEVDHHPEDATPVAVTPLVRFFQGPALLELGYTPAVNEAMFTFMYRF
jgi:hypothetical protein